MQLLSPNDVQASKAASAEEGRKRNLDIAAETSRLTAELNRTRQAVSDVKNEASRETEVYLKELKQKRDEALREVTALEARRKEAMKPVKKLWQEAQKLALEAEERLKLLKEQEKILERRHEELVEKIEATEDVRDELIEQQERIKDKELRVQDEANRLKQSHAKLAQAWVDFHSNVHTKNAELAERERKVEDALQVIEARHNQQEEREKEQDKRERALRDRYVTLARTERELQGKER